MKLKIVASLALTLICNFAHAEILRLDSTNISNMEVISTATTQELVETMNLDKACLDDDKIITYIELDIKGRVVTLDQSCNSFTVTKKTSMDHLIALFDTPDHEQCLKIESCDAYGKCTKEYGIRSVERYALVSLNKDGVNANVFSFRQKLGRCE